MTSMNWENVIRTRTAQRRDTSTDFPLRTGSVGDQARYGIFPLKQTKSRKESRPGKPNVVIPSQLFRDLDGYTKSVSCSDFRRKSTVAQVELLNALKRSITRCEGYEQVASKHDQELLIHARQVLQSRMM